MDDQALIRWLWDHGYFWGPDYPETLNVKQSDLPTLKLTDAVVRFAFANAQKADANFDAFVWKHHNRAPIADGLVGPATLEFVRRLTDPADEFRRCPLPDFAPPDGARFHYDDPNLQAAVESMQLAAALEGPYWRGCDPQRPDMHSLVIGIDTTRAPANWRANRDKILEARRKLAAEIGVAVRFVLDPQSMAGLQQYQVFQSIPGNVIGYNYFPNGGCGKITNGALDTGFDPSNWLLHACLDSHESEGHGFGFNHTRGGNMNPSILLIDPLTWVGDPAWSQVTKYYPAKPLDLPPPSPGPTPVPGGQKVWIRNADGLEVIQEVVALQDFAAKKGDVLGQFYYKAS